VSLSLLGNVKYECGVYLSCMPVTYYDEETVRKVLELRSRGLGYRRIGNALGVSKDVAMRICRAYAEGRIKLKENGAVEFVYKPAGVIKYQKEGLWDPSTRSFVKLPESKVLSKDRSNASAEPIKALHTLEPSPSFQKVFKVRFPKPKSSFVSGRLLSIHDTFSKILPTELPLPPPFPPMPPKRVAQELLYVKPPCPSCGRRIGIKPPEWSYDLKRRVLCEYCGALIEVEFVD